MAGDERNDQAYMHTRHGEHYIAVNEEGKLRSGPPMWLPGTPYQQAYQKPIDAGLDKGHLVFFIHGGLNDLPTVEARIAEFDHIFGGEPWHLVHLAWDTAIGSSFDEVIDRWNHVNTWRNLLRVAGYLLLWNLFGDRRLRRQPATYFGGIIWKNHYDTANAALTAPTPNSADRDQGFYRAFQYLNTAIQDKPDAKISFVVHSAGSIVANYLLGLIATEFPNLAGRVRNYILMAPACHITQFREAMAGIHTENPPTVLNLTPDLEVADQVGLGDKVPVYDKSILWAIFDRFEAGWNVRDLAKYRIPLHNGTSPRDTANWGILGLEEHLAVLGEGPNNLLEWDPPKVVERVRTGESVALAGHPEQVWTKAQNHGAFDNDQTTFESIKRLLK